VGVLVALGDRFTRRYSESVTFRDRLVATLRAVSPILDVDGVLVVGSEVPNLRERGAASTLVLEKLVTDRTGIKGDRDLLVVLGMLLVASDDDVREVVSLYATLDRDHRHLVRSNLSLLSLLGALPGMPDPVPHRALVASLLVELERVP
jgi:hypothetical protein